MLLISKCCGDPSDAIAGKPAPTGFCVVPKIIVHLDPCGSWLASDEDSRAKK